MFVERLLRRHVGRLPWLARYFLGKANIGGVNIVIDRHYEYAFTMKCLAELGARGMDILEVGGCGSVLPLMMAGLGNRVVEVDLYPWDIKYPDLRVITGNVLDVQLDEHFDVAVCISVVEHIGLSRYGPPTERLDAAAVAAMRKHLRDEGRLILSVPYGQDRTFPRYHHAYDARTFAVLTEGFAVERQEFFAPLGRIGSLEPCAEAETHRFGRRPLPYAITCALLRKIPS